MSLIRMFRVNAYDCITPTVEFYFKAERESDGTLICDFCIGDEGIFYYRKGSKILTANETLNARSSFDGFISMADLGDLFEKLKKAGLAGYEYQNEKLLKITRHGKKVVIEPAD